MRWTLLDGRQENAFRRDRPAVAMRRVLVPACAALTLVSVHFAAQAMEQATSPNVGTVWWAELRTRQPQKTQDFYASVLGWTPKIVAQDDTSRPPAAGEQSYTVFTMGGQEVAGAEEIPLDATTAAKPGWLTYVQVADVDEAARRAQEHGGKIIQVPVDVPQVGRMAEIEDPEGNRVGLVSPSK